MDGTLSSLVGLLPFGYAFGAGVITMLSPCGIALLPPYVSMQLGEGSEEFRRPSALTRWGKAIGLSLVVTAGATLLFAAMGAIVSLGGRYVTALIPWLAVVIGVGLIVTGAWLLSGRHVYAAVFSRLAGKLGRGTRRPVLRFLLFGLVYGVGALSCTFPVFLAVVGSALSMRDLAAGVLQFVSYALGMGTVMVGVTLGVVFFKEALHRWMERASAYVMRAGGVLLIGSGAYILYYWFKVGGLLGW